MASKVPETLTMSGPRRGLKSCIIAAVAILEALIMNYLEPSGHREVHLQIAYLLGTAVFPFIAGVIAAVFIRGWRGVIVGILLLSILNLFSGLSVLVR